MIEILEQETREDLMMRARVVEMCICKTVFYRLVDHFGVRSVVQFVIQSFDYNGQTNCYADAYELQY